MADNRLWLRCRNCGKHIGIATHSMSEWVTSKSDEELGASIKAFLQKHTWCGNGFNDFQLVTEMTHETPCSYPEWAGGDRIKYHDNCQQCKFFKNGNCSQFPLENRDYDKEDEEIKKFCEDNSTESE